MNPRLRFAILMIAGACAVSACGRLGDLERPAPMSGPDRRAAEESARREGSVDANKAARPNSTGEVKDPARSSATIRQQPIRGSNPDPFGGPSGPGMPNSGPQ